jgi:RNA polymerase sigma-70 factor (ECF subfamily)
MAASHWVLLFDAVREGTSDDRPSHVRSEEIRPAPPHPAPSPDMSHGGVLLDQELVSRIRAGDAAAFRSLFDATWTPLVEYAMRHVHVRETAIDVVQDVFARLWERHASLHMHGSVRGYLYGAIRKRAGSVWAHEHVVARSEHRMVGEAVAMGEAPVPGDEALINAEERRALRDALRTLPPRTREVMLLRWYDGLSYDEIATALGIRPATVNVHLTRAMQALRAQLNGRP